MCCGTANEPICVLTLPLRALMIWSTGSVTPSFNITYAYMPWDEKTQLKGQWCLRWWENFYLLQTCHGDTLQLQIQPLCGHGPKENNSTPPPNSSPKYSKWCSPDSSPTQQSLLCGPLCWWHHQPSQWFGSCPRHLWMLHLLRNSNLWQGNAMLLMQSSLIVPHHTRVRSEVCFTEFIVVSMNGLCNAWPWCFETEVAMDIISFQHTTLSL